MAVTLQRANAVLLRTWASKCFVGAAGAAAAAPDPFDPGRGNVIRTHFFTAPGAHHGNVRVWRFL